MGLRPVLAAVAALLLFSSGLGPAAAEAPEPGVDENPLLAVFPAAINAKAPDWVKSGTRISYRAGAVVFGASGTLLAPEPDGTWIDPATGNRYADKDLWKPGTGGQGFTQVDVVHASDRRAVIAVSSFAVADPAKPPLYGGASGLVALPGAGGPYWISPEVLATATETSTPTATVRKAPYAVDGKSYDAVWVRAPTPTGLSTWVYDVATGVMLMGASATHPPASSTQQQQPGSTPAPGLTLTRTVHLGTRQLNIPWADKAAPDWVSTVSSISFSGTLTQSRPGSTPASHAMTSKLDVLTRGVAWLRLRGTTVIGAGTEQPATSGSDGVAGPAQLGGQWISPEGLAALTAGQKLDTDPYTGSSVSVASVDAQTVTLTGGNSTFNVSTTYDRAKGALQHLVFEDRLNGNKIDLRRAP